MKEVFVPIDNAGRLVLPKGVREELGINPGDMLKVSIRGDEVLLQPKRGRAGFVKRGQALIFSTGGDDLLRRETVDEILNDERESRASRAKTGLPKPKRNS